MADHPFPGPDTLCEACGYSLQGLGADQACPECGSPVRDSDPARRVGLPWQDSISFGSWLRTVRAIVFSPASSFRHMRVDGSNRNPRLFLFTFVVLIGLLWAVVSRIGQLPVISLQALAAATAVLGMTYIEALGVAYFSRRRAWRVPWRLAERIVCYASVGWVPAGLVMVTLWVLHHHGTLERWWPTQWGPWTADKAMALFVLVGTVSILGFETLVWLAVRQTRFANSGRLTCPGLTPGVAANDGHTGPGAAPPGGPLD